MDLSIVNSIRKVFSYPTKTESQQKDISTSEAHSLWLILKDRYIIIEQLNWVKNYSHDKDYIYLLKMAVETLKQENEQLEGLLEKYSIPAPVPNVRNINVIGNTEAMVDRVSSHYYFNYLRTEIMIISHALRGALLNDDIRDLLIKFLNNNLERFNTYVDYMQLKEWLDFPPQYKYFKQDVKERVAINEISLLWDHLNFRNVNIKLTRIVIADVDDTDFRALLEFGLRTLVKQADELEKFLLHYGVQLPEKFSPTSQTVVDSEMINDRFIYLLILEGMRDAASLHAMATSQILTNKKLRQFFMELTAAEWSYISKLIKYGKLKGWVPIPPQYKMGTS